jgi:hypothetical protein
VRGSYLVMGDDEYDEFTAHVSFHSKHKKNEDWETFHLDDVVAVLCEECWNMVMKDVEEKEKAKE